VNDVHVNRLALFCKNGGGCGCTVVRGEDDDDDDAMEDDDDGDDDEEEDEDEDDDETFFSLFSCLFVISVAASDLLCIPSEDGVE